eukprot:6827516-Prorocentrum_lima.AAC.1
MCKRVDTCPATGDRFHVFSLGHGLPATPMVSEGKQTWSSLPVDRLLLGVEKADVAGLPREYRSR